MRASKFCTGILSAALAALSAAAAGAAINQSINYQGFLLSKVTSQPVDSPQSFRFSLYSGASGGASLFTETRCGVRVSRGRYDVEIGSTTAGGLPADIIAGNTALWLEISVSPSADCSAAFEPMTPRVRLQASPYAFSALYASTASAATPDFRADVIGALPTTTFGAVTISTNLFVQGGISVGSISPGQKLSVAGVVESTGNWPTCGDGPDYTCGFKFPDGSVQVKAAALTMWDISGINLYTINEGNTNIGGGVTNPQARLHISSAAGSGGPLLLVSTGTGASQSQLFLVDGNGRVYGNSFYGDGTTLTGVLRRAGDTMSGQLTLANSTLTVTSPSGASLPKVRLAPGVEISSYAPTGLFRGGVAFSSHVFLLPGATYYGDGSGLYNVVSSDTSKVLKEGDTMTGQLTISNSSLTVTGSAFSVTGSSFSVFGGSVAIGGFAYPARLSVTGGIQATSSVTASGGLYGSGVFAPSGLGHFFNLTAATATINFWDTSTGYSLDTASGVKVRDGVVDAPYFVGNGSLLTSVVGTDATKLLKAGDTMTGNLLVSGASVTVAAGDLQFYALTVGTAAAVNNYALAVGTSGYVGVMVNNPAAPLNVNERILVSNSGGNANLDMQAYAGFNYLSFRDGSLSSNGPAQGSLGYPVDYPRDLVYRAMGTSPVSGGQEVFRVKSDDFANWRFGLGTDAPSERFHVAGNVLVSTAANSPVFYVSTTTRRVGLRTLAPTHALTVNGGLLASSSVTAQELYVATLTAVSGNPYGGVVVSTPLLSIARLAFGTDNVGTPFQHGAGQPFPPPTEDYALHMRGGLILDHKADQDIILSFSANTLDSVSADSYIRWKDPVTGSQGVLGTEALFNDLVYKAGGSTMDNGVEAFRVKSDGRFIVGSGGTGFAPQAPFHVMNNMAVGFTGQAPVLFVSTGLASVGVSTAVPKERFHVGATMLVGPDKGSAYLYVSTRTGYVGISTAVPQARLDVGGFAHVASSLTISGLGTSGSQTAFSVIGSTLIVRADGLVGIGTAPTERLEVAGKVKASGFAAGRERVAAACGAVANCTATCTAGKIVMGGGCRSTNAADTLLNSYPPDDSSWQCDYSAAAGNVTAYAVCSTVE